MGFRLLKKEQLGGCLMRHEFPVVLMLTVPDCEVTSWYRSDWTTRRYIRITLTCTLFQCHSHSKNWNEFSTIILIKLDKSLEPTKNLDKWKMNGEVIYSDALYHLSTQISSNWSTLSSDAFCFFTNHHLVSNFQWYITHCDTDYVTNFWCQSLKCSGYNFGLLTPCSRVRI